jgi:hypothetical protein
MIFTWSGRGDFTASDLRGFAKETKDGPQARRLLALAAIYDGAPRSEAAKIGGVGLQIIRDWVLRFNARGPDGLLNRKSPGQPSKLSDAQREAIGRSSRLALINASGRTIQYHHHRHAAEIAGAQPSRKHLAVHARQLAFKPRLLVLRKPRRSLLLRLEQAR